MVRLQEAERKQAASEEHAKIQEAEKAAKLAPKAETKTAKGKEKKDEKAKPVKTNASLEDLDIILYPLVTEKAVNMIEAENKITFVVSDKASRQDVKRRIEHAYGVKVAKVNIVRDRKGKKKALVRLKKEFKADELATKLGVL